MTQLDHFPGRPHWHCTTCGDHWPCAPARQAMLAAARNGTAGGTTASGTAASGTTTNGATAGIRALRVSMLATQAEAESDFEQLGTLAVHGDLHDRFVSWVTPS